MRVGAADGMALAFALVAANTPERQAAAEVLEPLDLHGDTLTDKRFAGADFEALLDSLGASFLRPDRQDERRRHDSLGQIRQSIESVLTRSKDSSR